MYHCRILAAARHLPEQVVTNRDLIERYGFPHPEPWFEATGIHERRFASPGETTISLGTEAVRKLARQCSLREHEVDVLLFTSVTCELRGPSGAITVAHQAGLRPGLAFDLTAACAGFVAAFDVAHQYLRGGARRVLIVSSEVQSRHVYFGADGDHHKFAGILGDAAGAVLLERSEEVGVEGSARATLPEYCRNVFSMHETVPEYPHIPPGTILYPDEQGIISAFLRLPLQVCHQALDQAGARPEQLDWLITHQPRMDMLRVIGRELGVSPERHYINVQRYGNTTSASIPLCLSELMEAGRLQRGQRLLMLGMGAGFTAVAHVLRY